MERRLAAILAADVVGYSRLVEHDEAAALSALKSLQNEVIEPLLAERHGRIVKLMGDGVIAEFGSVVDAVACAAALQRAVAARQLGVAADRQIMLRIGVNIGDVVVEGDDLLGDGVNVAARLEQLCEPGDVLISGTAYDHLKGKLDLAFEPQGEKHLKNISEPIRVYGLRLSGRPGVSPKRAARLRRGVVSVAVLAMLLIAAFGGWMAYDRWAVAPQRAPAPALPPLPDKPSIAVLPFTNMSGDPQQEYFADGMTDDLITDLSQISGLFVIARNSSFTYKGKPIDIRQVARELGVRYVLEGSVQRAGDQVRVNAQLIDAMTDGHKWADRYDGTMAEIFALQDKVTHSIADALALRLTKAEQRSLERETAVPAAYDAFLQGWERYRRATPTDFAQAIPHFDEAIRLDPSYGRAYAALAMIYIQSYVFAYWQGGLGVSYIDIVYRAHLNLKKAMEHPTSTAYQASAMLSALGGDGLSDLDSGAADLNKAIAIDPGDSWSYAYLGWILSMAGHSAEALRFIDTAARLDPNSPAAFFFFRGFAQLSLGRFAEAATSLEASVKRNPDDPWPFVHLASAYGYLGRIGEAKAAIARFDALSQSLGGSRMTILLILEQFPFADSDDRERLIDGLRKAGLSQ